MRSPKIGFSVLILLCFLGASMVSATDETAQIDATDVIHQVDGTELLGKLTTFDGVVFTVNIQGEPIQIPRAEVVSIALGQPQLRPKLLYVGSDTDDLANYAVANALEVAGFDLTSATTLPASLDEFDVVVLESFSASSEDAAKMLRSFAGKGGGVVLVGTVPKALSPEGELNKYCKCWDLQVYAYPWDTSAIADWLGGATMEQVEISNPRISASITNPFYATPDIAVGQDLFVFKGNRWVGYFVTGSLSARAQPVAKIRFEIDGIECTHIAAFANPFGEGRVYYQYMSYEPNHPKLVELLVAGTKWTAGILPEVR